jgi:hypothetical protein
MAALIVLFCPIVSPGFAKTSRSPDCEAPTVTPSHRLSVSEARGVLEQQFSRDGGGTSLSYEGLDYACVTRYREGDLREVAVFGREGSDLRLFVGGPAEAGRLQDAINRLIQDARDHARKKSRRTPLPAR